jgi:hypothetical protein
MLPLVIYQLFISLIDRGKKLLQAVMGTEEKISRVLVFNDGYIVM